MSQLQYPKNSRQYGLDLGCMKLTNAWGISSFIRPVNISFHSARFSSGCEPMAFPIAFAASTPKVFPSKFKNSIFFEALIASVTNLAETKLRNKL